MNLKNIRRVSGTFMDRQDSKKKKKKMPETRFHETIIQINGSRTSKKNSTLLSFSGNILWGFVTIILPDQLVQYLCCMFCFLFGGLSWIQLLFAFLKDLHITLTSLQQEMFVLGLYDLSQTPATALLALAVNWENSGAVHPSTAYSSTYINSRVVKLVLFSMIFIFKIKVSCCVVPYRSTLSTKEFPKSRRAKK